jgi:hypothetical protein
LDFRLPLANELFESRDYFRTVLAEFPAARPAISELIDIADSETIEDRLEKMAAQARGADPTRAKQLLAIQYYISRMIWQCEDNLLTTIRHITNHATLIDEIHRFTPIDEEIFIVTFNYDRLIERALMATGSEFSSIRSYLHNERFKVIKLHGSVDWVTPLAVRPILNSAQPIVQQLIALAPTIKLTDQYELVTGFTDTIAGIPVVPAIAIPVMRKDKFLCPPEHVSALTDFLPKVSRILIVGWKGADEAFVNLLAKHLPRSGSSKKNPAIAIVGGTDAAITKNHLDQAQIMSSSYIVKDKGFTSLTRTILTDPWFEEFMVRA